MAGHFLLWSITFTELNELPPGAHWWGNELQHANVGWNDDSRAVLDHVRTGQGIENRAGLPPHRYLQFDAFPHGRPDHEMLAFLFSVSALWKWRLKRPEGLGLRALCPEAQGLWNDNRYTEALIAQMTHGATSIEVYYVRHRRNDDREMD